MRAIEVFLAWMPLERSFVVVCSFRDVKTLVPFLSLCGNFVWTLSLIVSIIFASFARSNEKFHLHHILSRCLVKL